MTKLQRVVFVVFRVTCYMLAITWLINLATMASFSTRSPEPATDHVQAWDDHGVILYRKPIQGMILIWGWVGALAFGLAGNTIEDKNWWRYPNNLRRSSKWF